MLVAKIQKTARPTENRLTGDRREDEIRGSPVPWVSLCATHHHHLQPRSVAVGPSGEKEVIAPPLLIFTVAPYNSQDEIHCSCFRLFRGFRHRLRPPGFRKQECGQEFFCQGDVVSFASQRLQNRWSSMPNPLCGLVFLCSDDDDEVIAPSTE